MGIAVPGRPASGRAPTCAKEPKAKLTNEIEFWVHRTPNGGVMTLALAVILPARNVHGGGAPEARYAVPGVEVEPQVTHLEGCQFGYPEAADGGEGHHESIPVIPKVRRPHEQKASDDAAMNREQERGRAAHQGGEATRPG